MKCDKQTMLLYAVTDRAWTGEKSLYRQVEEALKGGITCLQLREKHLNRDLFLQEAVEICKLCKSYNVPFIVNDDVEIAIKSGADGVHVGQDDMSVGRVRRLVGENMIIGVSAHSVDEALAAAGGADYLGVGAMFGSATKTDANVTSKGTLKEICRAVDLPVVAIGGINKSNILQLTGRGMDGFAMVSAIFAAEDIENECKILRSLSRQAVSGNLICVKIRVI